MWMTTRIHRDREPLIPPDAVFVATGDDSTPPGVVPGRPRSGGGKSRRPGAVSPLVRRLTILMLVLSSCAAGPSPEDGGAVAPPSTPAREEIRVPLSLYVVRDGGDATSGLSSARTIEEARVIADDIGAIWAAADIVFDPIRVHEIDVPSDVLRAISESLDAEPFFAQVGRTFEVPDPGVVNGFLVRVAGGVNGFAPTGGRIFFVVDEPTVHDERVSSHELGHIFGLRHALDDPGRLMFSGTNGISLSAEEQVVARYGLEGLRVGG